MEDSPFSLCSIMLSPFRWLRLLHISNCCIVLFHQCITRRNLVSVLNAFLYARYPFILINVYLISVISSEINPPLIYDYAFDCDNRPIY